MKTGKKTNAWGWVPTLYFAEGLPYVAVMTVAVIMYKRLGLSNTEIALYTSWLYLPWGDQAVLESVRRPAEDETLVDRQQIGRAHV